MRRRTTRKQKGRGCGCGGMEMLGFPKSGGFMSLFGGQEMMKEQAPQEMMRPEPREMMKEQAPQEMMKSEGSQRKRSSSEEASPQEIIGNSQMPGVSYSKQPKQDMPQGQGSYGTEPTKTRRSGSSSALGREIRQMKSDIETLKYQVSGLQSSPRSQTGSPGLFGGGRRRKTYKKRKSRR
jgi:hypothetical protein